MMKRWWIGNFILLQVGLVGTLHASAANHRLQVTVKRWLEVRQPIGQVLYYRGNKSQPARNGLRLQAVGDTIITKQNSSAVLAIDIGTGFIKVAENTNINIQKLQRGKRGEQITQLQVKTGQVRLQVRQFTNPASRLEIKSPAGVAGVRGTDFGVNVQENGSMGVATLTGGVATNAQGKTVLVKAGFQNITIPGKPPSKPVPLQNNTDLNIRELSANGNQVRIVGTVDPVNLLIIAQQEQKTDVNGKFDITVPLLPNRRVEAVVVTPLGKKQFYELAVP
ncbi:FecR family protein [Nodularia spumigena CS-591/12]|uniref:FecR family protein n=1 Tax=Nodularia spumigena TaxID=70799 RepID=UPI00232BF040|nr:FecR family protein [Nodularia spumigena]MDB9306993.1 FecR family protein [Nodularia spumigena CS-591/12]MDB9345370.1 FecR family protein [Nodularia spumigena CS-588/06]MDB9369779.1 FecR family protein [Nodularia spumigena CS-586/05]